ncbi:uncharacterized protein LOC133814272 [Humulus lupulus]|uniref:uncharacterized protein LOC133814272 n=1 Tax=Humulus lupulus TaxID=3486 RepID=UPI002B407588|nr:uncharacterized protein LOC133814272 [Humulus lupulus]
MACNVDTAVTTFRKGLMVEFDLYKELTKYHCRTMEDVLAKARAQIKWEEYESNRSRPFQGGGRASPQRSRDFQERGQSSQRFRNYQDKAPILEDTLTIDHVKMVAVMKGMENKVKWARKIQKPEALKDMTKWCEFHSDHGNTTTECIALKFEVAGLLRRGQLRDFLSNKGGLEVGGITYSVAKRHAREPVNNQGKPRKPETVAGQTISFVNDEATDLLHPHHDDLVISLYIANCFIKRVLIDNGSSANILFLNVLRDMKVDESTIIGKYTVLIGFSGEQKHSIGEINLHVWAEGVNLHTKFIIVDCPSSYNAILGQPWIHEMEVVPSTYHQVIKFSTPWGLKQILRAQKRARDYH